MKNMTYSLAKSVLCLCGLASIYNTSNSSSLIIDDPNLKLFEKTWLLCSFTNVEKGGFFAFYAHVQNFMYSWVQVRLRSHLLQRSPNPCKPDPPSSWLRPFAHRWNRIFGISSLPPQDLKCTIINSLGSCQENKSSHFSLELLSYILRSMISLSTH